MTVETQEKNKEKVFGGSLNWSTRHMSSQARDECISSRRDGLASHTVTVRPVDSTRVMHLYVFRCANDNYYFSILNVRAALELAGVRLCLASLILLLLLVCSGHI